jgi:hypothetical protein
MASSGNIQPASDTLDAEERARLSRLIFWGFILRAGVALLLEWTNLSERFAPDEQTYRWSGFGLAQYWAGKTYFRPTVFSSDQPLGYFYINGVFSYVFGRTEIPLKLLNAFIGANSCRYAFYIARALFGREVAARTATLFTFFPSLVLWSALNIRDVWVIWLILFISWKSLQVVRGYSALATVHVLVGIFALTYFRDYLFYIVAIPPVAAFLIGGRGSIGRNFLITLGAALGIVYLVQQGAAQRAEFHMSFEVLSQTRQNMAFGGSAFGQDVDISTPGKALAFLPVGIAYFLFAPFPWQITSLLKAFSLPEMILMYGLVPAMVRGAQYAIRERFRECLQVLLLTLLLTVSYALGEGNVGTLYRHRAQVVTFYLMFGAVGLELKRARAAERAA